MDTCMLDTIYQDVSMYKYGNICCSCYWKVKIQAPSHFEAFSNRNGNFQNNWSRVANSLSIASYKTMRWIIQTLLLCTMEVYMYRDISSYINDGIRWKFLNGCCTNGIFPFIWLDVEFYCFTNSSRDDETSLLIYIILL